MNIRVFLQLRRPNLKKESSKTTEIGLSDTKQMREEKMLIDEGKYGKETKL